MNCEKCGNTIDEKIILETHDGQEYYCSEDCVQEVFGL